MLKRKLGRTHLHVSELCLNTNNFGWSGDEAAAFALLDAYFTSGGTFIQSPGFCPGTAGAEPPRPHPEEFVGRWRHSRGIGRDHLVLATWLNLVRPQAGGSITFANLIRECCETSLRRLRVTHLDLLVCEWDESLLPIDDVTEALDMLIRAGLVRFAIAGAFPAWRLVDSLNRSGIRRHARFEGLQSDYSLMTRARFEADALALCREQRLGFLARSPLAGGFLARQLVTPPDFLRANGEWLNERFGNHYGDTVMNAVATIAEKRQASPAQIALAWVLRAPEVTSALVTVNAPSELLELVHAATIKLTDDETATLAQVTTVQDYRMELRHV